MKKDACFFCKQHRHVTRDCPKKEKNSGYSQKAYKLKDNTLKKGKKDFKAYIRALTEEEKSQLTEGLIEDTNNNNIKKDLEDF